MSISFAGKRLLDPRTLAASCRRHQLPTPFLGRANSFRCTLGPEPGRGWVLLLRRDLDDLDLDGLHDLVFFDGVTRVTAKDLVIAEPPVCVTPGVQGDAKSAYLVELADVRHFAANRYYAQPLDRAYNVRAPAAPQTYYADTLNAGTAWTWQTLLDHIWGYIDVSQLGVAPALPFAPNGTPENFRFHGVPAWAAFNEVLNRLGCAFKLDPTKSASSGRSALVQLGATDAKLAQAQKDRARRLVWDPYPLTIQRGRRPAGVVVYFPLRRTDYGTEKATGWAAGQQDSTSPLHAITVFDPDSTKGVQAASLAALFDDLPALVNFANAVTNTAALTARANERAADYYRMFHTGGQPLQARYAGFHQDAGFLPGPQVTGIAWLDTGGGTAAPRGGWITEIARWPMLPRIEEGGGWKLEPWPGPGSDVAQQLRTPDLGRLTHPLWPPPGQLGRVTGTTTTANVFAGAVQRLDPAGLTYTASEACFIMALPPTTNPAVNDYVWMKLNGVKTATPTGGSPETRPFYVFC